MSELSDVIRGIFSVGSRHTYISSKVDKTKIPEHIAIIMDGNGRWATKKRLPRTAGHREGLNRVREVVLEGNNLGIKVLTLYAFSTENWKRPQEEVSFLMNLFREALRNEVEEMHKNGVRVRFIGNRHQLDDDLLAIINDTEKKTAGNDGLILNLAINYGGRSEILRAVRSLSSDLLKGKLKIDEIEERFSDYLDTAGLPDPDMIIRTSGEQRLSNFLLWQSAYSELIFFDLPWPEFTADRLHEAILKYQKRNRRFGGIKK